LLEASETVPLTSIWATAMLGTRHDATAIASIATHARVVKAARTATSFSTTVIALHPRQHRRPPPKKRLEALESDTSRGPMVSGMYTFGVFLVWRVRVTHMSLPTDAAVSRLSAEALSSRTCEALLRGGTVLEPREVACVGVKLGRTLTQAYASGPSPLPAPGADGPDAALYSAPETLVGQRTSQQSDVYAVGVVLYRLLAGAFPVSAPMVHQGRHLEAWTARDDLRASGSRVPMPLAKIVEKAIDPRPKARYVTLQALCADLHEAAEQLLAPKDDIRCRILQIASLAAMFAIAALIWVVAHVPDEQPVAVSFDYRGTSNDARAVVDGMTIEVARLLAQAEGLHVHAELSASPGGDPLRDAGASGSQRLPSFVVSGSVYGDAGAWRHVEASLIRVRPLQIVWSGTFSLADGDIFAVQERIAAAVVEALEAKVAPGGRRHWTTPALQEVFLKARVLQASGADARRRHAAEMFRLVMRAAPDFVPAAAALATTLGGVSSESPDLPALDPDLAAVARRAHADDPHLAESNAAMGLLSARLCRWREGRAYFREALERDPSAMATYVDYAISILLPSGDTREAVDVLTTALKTDASSLRLRRTLAHALVENGEYSRAIEVSRSVIQEGPGLEAAHQTLGRALYLSGRLSEAAEVLQTWESQWAYRGYAMAAQGHDIEARMLAEAHHDEPARQMLIYAGLKDVDGTVDALLRTAGVNPWRAMTWMTRREIAPVLRGDARAAAVRDQLQQPAGCSRD
jgi:TolB-like protein